MKRTIILILFGVFAVSIAQAQRSEVRRAERMMNRGQFEAAKEHIDNAVQDESTKSDAGTWLLKAEIYMQIALAEEPEVRELAPNAVEVADDAIVMANSLEPNNMEVIQIQQLLLVLSELTYNEGVEYFTQDQYVEASKKFRRSYELNEQFGHLDTMTYYNAALAAEMGRDYDSAKEILKDLIDMEFEEPFLFTSLANIYMIEGDTIQALEYVKQGRELYPEDLNIIFSEANIYIFTGDVEQAKDVLALAIEMDPENPGLYFALAANFDRMAQDTTYTHDDREGFYEQAERYYKLAIEKDEEFFDAIFNLGVLYFNEGIRMYEAADEALRKTQDFAQWAEDEQAILAAWLRAQPYFEKSKEMITIDDDYYETVIISLIQLYARTNQPEKLSEIEKIYIEHFAVDYEDE